MNKVGADPEVYVAMDGWMSGSHYKGILPAATVFSLAEDVGFEINDYHNANPAYSTYEGKLIVDGISLELNPRAGSPTDLVNNTKSLLRDASNMLMYLNEGLDDRFELFIRPISSLQLEMLDVWGDPRLAMFGCDPDAIIYGEREVDPSTINAVTHPWRYFGGHAHIEWREFGDPRVFFADPDNLYRAIYTCDCTLGPASVILDQVVSKESEKRRKVYGQPSAHRPQDWGLEYRYPTNSWLLSPERMKMFFSIAQQIPEIVDVINDEFADDEVDVRATLIAGDVAGSQKLLEKVKSVVSDYDLSACIDNLIDVSRYSVRNWRREWLN